MINKLFTNTYLILILIFILFILLIPIQNNIDKHRPKRIQIEKTVYLNSSILKKLCLGYGEILADIYWLWSLKYFGDPNVDINDKDPELLYKYFDILTDLDPKFFNAYRFGGTFLAEPIPRGLGNFELGTALFDKGRENNPNNFRLPLEQAFLYFFHSDNYKKSSELFIKASEKPGLSENRKASLLGMAASVNKRGGDNKTAKMIWKYIYQNSPNEKRREFALKNLKELESIKKELN